MAVRTVTVRLNAEASNMIAELQKAEIAARKVAEEGRRTEAAMTKVGDGLLKFGAAGAAGLTLVGKAAMDWESAWAGVTKTVDGSAQEMAALEGELRNLATTLPASHQEIAAVAEAAGQLGIKREDVAGFTKTMIDLGETTNLTADEAATSLAQFSNIMGTSADDVDRLGSTIVALGNDGASTERDIVQMGLRIAGAGKQIGLSETDVFAFASALSSVGIEAEAGGTAISTFMLQTEQSVRKGGKELDLLARTAGMTSDQFAQAFEQDAAGALDAFLQGLGRAQASGEDTTAILEELGVTGIRQADAIRRLASSGDLLSKSLETGSSAWEENLALAEEAAKRYDTTESKIRVAWNTIKDAAIDAGAAILPVVATVAEAVAGFAQGFADLPPGMQTAATAAVAVVTAVSLIGGAIITLLPKIAATRAAMVDMGKASPGIARGVGKIGGAFRKAAGAASAFGLAAAGAAAAGAAIASFQPKTRPVIEYENALIALAKGGDGAADAMNRLLDEGVWGEAGTQVTDLSSAFRQLAENENFFNNAISKAGDALGGIKTSQRAVQSQFEAIDQALAGMDSEQAVKAFREVARAADDAGISNEDLLATFPEYKARLMEVANQLNVTSLSAEDYVKWMGGEVPEAVKKAASGNKEAEQAVERASGEMRDAAKAAEQYAEQLNKLADQALANSDAEIGFEQAIDDATASVKENGRNLNLNTQAGRDNQRALNMLAGRARDYIKTLKDQNADTKTLTAAQKRAEDQIYKAGRAMGKSEADARAYARQMLGIPAQVDTTISTPGSRVSKREIDDINRKLRAIPPEKSTKVVALMESGQLREGKRLLDSLYSKTVTLTVRKRSIGSFGLSNARVINSFGLHYASGGVLPGYTPGRDVHHFRSPTGGNLHLSGGEAIMRPEWTRAVGGPAAVDRMNAAARSGQAFADGGTFNGGASPYVPAPYMPDHASTVTAAPQTSVQQYFTQVNPDAALIAAGQRLRGLR